MRVDVVSLFPEFVAQMAGFGVVGRAVEAGLVHIHGWNPRDYAQGAYRRVDDRPFGGGPGMVMLIDPLRDALRSARAADPRPARTIYLSPQGVPLTQARVAALAAEDRLLLLCGRYEGIDERLVAAEVDEELSIGDYVLSGGELAAAVVIDAVARLRPGVLNDDESAQQDSFGDGLLDCPHYTRPPRHELGDVPAVLLSGHHGDIAAWRREQSLARTRQRRPDLLAASGASDRERGAPADRDAAGGAPAPLSLGRERPL